MLLKISRELLKINSGEILIKVPQNHKLLALANIIDWQKIADLVDADLNAYSHHVDHDYHLIVTHKYFIC